MGLPPEVRFLAHELSNDGASVILGDPGDGMVVSATPVAGTQYQKDRPKKKVAMEADEEGLL